MKINYNATGLLHQMLQAIGTSINSELIYAELEFSELAEMYVVWHNKKTIKEMIHDKNIPEHNKSDKLKKIEYSKIAATENVYTNTSLFAMAPTKESPLVIIDGIHRAIGLYRAFNENPKIQNKTSIMCLLGYGSVISNIDDYIKSIP